MADIRKRGTLIYVIGGIQVVIIIINYYFFTTEQQGSEWVLVDVVNHQQRGSRERVKEKMVKICERAKAVIGEKVNTQHDEEALAISQANEIRLEERVREERQRADETEMR